MAQLLLITRAGCCLCKGLEDKLLARFDLEVPVLLRREGDSEAVLPRVSPRLTPPQLQAWLERQGLA